MWDNRQIIFIENDTEDKSSHAIQCLSKTDRRVLWRGLILSNFCMFFLFCLFLIFYTNRINRNNEEQLKKLMKMAAAYMICATDDEYDEIAKTIRNDLILSEYNDDIKELASYIPNTAGVCSLGMKKFSAQAYIVCTNTGEIYPMDLFLEGESPDDDYDVGYLSYGFDEISQSNICISRTPSLKKSTITLYQGKSIVSIQRMKSVFCENCIEEILDIAKNHQIKEFFIFDRIERIFYPVSDGSKFRIGNYAIEIMYTDGNYEIVVEYMK